MFSQYPWYIPNPDPKAEPPHDKILVKTPDEHKRVNPEHFEEEQRKAQQTTETELPPAQQVLREREKNARIAESMQRGNKLGDQIAAAIRQGLKPGQVPKLLPAGDPNAAPQTDPEKSADSESDGKPEPKADPKK